MIARLRLAAFLVSLTDRDKLQHMLGCALLTVGLDAFVSLPVAAGIVLTIGVSKELFEPLKPGGFDWGDIAADVLGIGLIVVHGLSMGGT